MIIGGLRKYRISLIICVLWFFAPAHDAQAYEGQNLIHHEIEAKIRPKEHRITVQDEITVPRGNPREFTFRLHKGLNPSALTKGVKVWKEPSGGDSIANSYMAALPSGISTFVISYGGVIDHPLKPVGKEQARGFSDTPGIISEEGVYLSKDSFWYPVIKDTFVSFSLKAELPAGWDLVSQGKRVVQSAGKTWSSAGWNSPEPQEGIFAIAGRFTEYDKQAGHLTAMVFLREPDEALARKYLEATIRYIAMYEKLIGPYPYEKFALVENFWETGFGMPSFTLLGPKVIRFPFIITSSYPHEILHNWWGNSVYPDFGTGNWSEGITAYLADHLLKEQEGAGAEYRQTVLQEYADYVSGGRDFPLTEFHSRHDPSTAAVGYGKSLMFFHMLRRQMGDEAFIRGLQDFYKNHRFSIATFNDMRKSLESVSGRDLGRIFHQWVERTGAPQLRLSNADAFKDNDGFTLTAELDQIQQGDAYVMRVPVAVTMESRKETFQTDVAMEGRHVRLSLHLPFRPLRIDVDPEFDLFRRLDRQEIPPAISQALGAKKMLVILPSSASEGLLKRYRGFAEVLGRSGPDEVEIKLDREVKSVPSDRAVAVLGWENGFLKDAISTLSGYEISIDQRSVRIGGTSIPKENHSLVLTGRNPSNKDMAIMFVAGPEKALPGLGRKLPHYHKYSYLGFEGEEPLNMAKGRWPVIDSPMTAFVSFAQGKEKEAPRVEMGFLAARADLISLSPAFSREKMMEIIYFLSNPDLRGRGLGTKELDKAAEFIAEKFREAGLKPAGDKKDSYFQTWEDSIDDVAGKPARKAVLKNVVGVIPGGKKEFSGQSVVVGAHYDHLGLGWPDVRDNNMGKIHPGADDNASGISVLIELAKTLAGLHPDRSIVFVAFTGEEAGKWGSRHYVADEKRYPADKCIAMVNMDTVGRLGKKDLFVLEADSAKEWGDILNKASLAAGVGIESVAEKLDSSDNMSFEDAGVPAMQLFSGPEPDYHRPTDTPDKIDADGLVKVAKVAKEIVASLASREMPLTAAPKTEHPETAVKKERMVSLGTIPDFGYKGEGYRLSGVMPGSPAEAAGLKAGDVIVRMNSRTIHGLKDVSDILKSLVPGSRVSITFLRAGKETTIQTEVRGK